MAPLPADTQKALDPLTSSTADDVDKSTQQQICCTGSVSRSHLVDSQTKQHDTVKVEIGSTPEKTGEAAENPRDGVDKEDALISDLQQAATTTIGEMDTFTPKKGDDFDITTELLDVTDEQIKNIISESSDVIENNYDSGDATVIDNAVVESTSDNQGEAVGEFNADISPGITDVDDETPQSSVITFKVICEGQHSTPRNDTEVPSKHELMAPRQSVSFYDGDNLASFFEHATQNVSLCVQDEDDLQLADISDEEDSISAININPTCDVSVDGVACGFGEGRDNNTSVPNGNTPVTNVKDNATRQSKSLYVESSLLESRVSSTSPDALLAEPTVSYQALSAKVSLIMSSISLNKGKLIEKLALTVKKQADAPTSGSDCEGHACASSRLDLRYLDDLNTDETGKDEHLSLCPAVENQNRSFPVDAEKKSIRNEDEKAHIRPKADEEEVKSSKNAKINSGYSYPNSHGSESTLKNGGERESASSDETKDLLLPEFKNISKREFKGMIDSAIEETMKGQTCPIPEIIPYGCVEFAKDSSSKPIKLGEGTYGVVMLGTLLLTGETVAIKLPKQRTAMVSQVICESLLMSKVKNTGSISELKGLCALENSTTYLQVAMVTQFIGDPITHVTSDYRTFLKKEEERLKNKEKSMLSRIEWLFLLWKMAENLSAIHREQVVVNDIKSDNIMVKRENGKWTTKFIDLGIAGIQYIDSQKPPLTNPFEIAAYMLEHPHIAPEWVIHSRVTTQSDVYSLGRILRVTGNSLSPLRLGIIDLADRCQDVIPQNRPNASNVSISLYSKYSIAKFER